jgi:hypothetical protein
MNTYISGLYDAPITKAENSLYVWEDVQHRFTTYSLQASAICPSTIFKYY